MKKLYFTKMVASGNDFVVIEDWHKAQGSRLKVLVKKICDRKYGIGADGVLFLEKSKIADTRMKIFNVDGSEAEMCGNGARCTALYISRQPAASSRPKKTTIETKAGIIDAEVSGDNVKIKLTQPKDIELDIPIKINKRLLKVNFINTGVPHTIVFVEGLKKIDAVNLGRQIRCHKRFFPAGTNADFVEILNGNSLEVRTYERGVEDETLACGTGSVASALLYAVYCALYGKQKINVVTKSREILKVYFDNTGNEFKDVWLEGKARKVYEGAYYV